jgi:NADH-quinone oxidoreductase subunit H
MIEQVTHALLSWLEGALGEGLSSWTYLAIVAFSLFTACALYATFGGWLERKIIARVHNRIGPMYAGPGGILQTVADLLKFLRKEVIFPQGSDRMLFALAPILLIIPSFAALALVPIGEFTVVRSEYSLLIVFALLSLGPIAVLVGSWASNSKYSTLGGLRAAGMMLSYEIVLTLTVMSLAFTAGSLDIVAIAAHQHHAGVWFAILQPIAFVLFLVAGVASVERNPFDIVEAESELVSGWKTEYGGVYFSLTLLAEYTKLLVLCLLVSALFLGGSAGGDAALLAKVLALTLCMFYIRATSVRMRLDRLLAKAWRGMVPVALLNIAATVALIAIAGGA